MADQIDRIINRAWENEVAAGIGVRPVGKCEAERLRIFALYSRLVAKDEVWAERLLVRADRERKLDEMASRVVMSKNPENN